MQLVQALTRLGEPLISARTRWMFGSHRRLFRLCENVTDLPNQGFFPQMSQTAAMAGQGYQRPRAQPAMACRFVIRSSREICPGIVLTRVPWRSKNSVSGGLNSP